MSHRLDRLTEQRPRFTNLAENRGRSLRVRVSHTHTHDRVSRLWPNIPSFLQVGGNCYTRVTINSDDVGSRERVQHDGFSWCFIFHRVESRIERRSDRVATKVNKLCFHIISTALTSNHMQIPCVLYIFCIHLSVKAVYESRDFCR